MVFSTDQWVRYLSPNPSGELRLFCFHEAGGRATSFSAWPQYLPAAVEVCALQLPGRAERSEEELPSSSQELIHMVAAAIAEHLDCPFAFFGHSLGAMLAFEVARLLRQKALLPIHLFFSGLAAPHLPGRFQRDILPWIRLSDDELLTRLSREKQWDALVSPDPAIRRALIALLRKDSQLLADYVYHADEPFACPLMVSAGMQDQLVSSYDLLPWQLHTTSTFSLKLFPGDHQYYYTEPAHLLEVLNEQLQEHLLHLSLRRARGVPAERGRGEVHMNTLKGDYLL